MKIPFSFFFVSIYFELIFEMSSKTFEEEKRHAE